MHVYMQLHVQLSLLVCDVYMHACACMELLLEPLTRCVIVCQAIVLRDAIPLGGDGMSGQTDGGGGRECGREVGGIGDGRFVCFE